MINSNNTDIAEKTNSQISSSWQSPSNIAFVKYWGKMPEQIPINPSISMVLKKSVTKTRLMIFPKNSLPDRVELYLDGKRESGFEKRIEKYFASLTTLLPFLQETDVRIETENTFPHSSGIASSASAFSAIALCLCSIESKMLNLNFSKNEFLTKASFIARLGSGSACRSLFPNFSLWGYTDAVSYSSNKVAVPILEVDKSFLSLNDTIILVDKSAKKISSSEGHKRMENHVYKDTRISHANLNIKKLLDALKSGDRKLFIEIIENEALTLHALMMTSHEPFVLFKSETFEVINKLWEWRKQKNCNIGFTLDAGANVHLIWFADEEKYFNDFISSLKSEHNFEYISDTCGEGPVEIE